MLKILSWVECLFRVWGLLVRLWATALAGEWATYRVQSILKGNRISIIHGYFLKVHIKLFRSVRSLIKINSIKSFQNVWWRLLFFIYRDQVWRVLLNIECHRFPMQRLGEICSECKYIFHERQTISTVFLYLMKRLHTVNKKMEKILILREKILTEKITTVRCFDKNDYVLKLPFRVVICILPYIFVNAMFSNILRKCQDFHSFEQYW